MTYHFPAQVAWSASANAPVKNVNFHVYATTDTGFTTPLPITDSSGVPIPGNVLSSGVLGVFPEFGQATNSTVVITDAAHAYAWTVNCIPSDASTAAFINDSTSATRAALSAAYVGHGDNFFSVKDFGAKGDGTTDDTAAIQAALNAVPAGGGAVYMPAGRYKVTSTINIVTDATKLFGAGAGFKTDGTQDARGTRIEAATGVTGSVVLVQGTANTRPLSGVILADFTIDGGNVGTAVDGIIFRSNQGHMERVHIWRCSGSGLRVLGYASWNTYDSTFHNLLIGYNTAAGGVLDLNSADSHWSHCVFLSNQDNFIVSGASAQVTGCHFYTAGRHDIWFDGGGSRAKFANCKIEGAKDHMVLIDSTNGGFSDIQFTGCGFSSLNSALTDNTYDYVLITGPTGNGISRTTFVGNNFNIKSGGTTIKPRYAINLDTSAVQNTVIVGNTFGPASNWGTAALRNASNASLAQFIKANFNVPDTVLPAVQTASYTLAATDANGVVVDMNSATPVTVTVPTAASSGLVKGNQIDLTQTGAGQVTIAAAAGVTLHTPRSLTTRAQYSTVRLRMSGTDTWVLSGDLT